jgi:hypothetical protein
MVRLQLVCNEARVAKPFFNPLALISRSRAAVRSLKPSPLVWKLRVWRLWRSIGTGGSCVKTGNP